MRNRVRMVVASFLTKNTLIDWHEGEQWFWEKLVDADAASNPFNGQPIVDLAVTREAALVAYKVVKAKKSERSAS